MEHCLMREISIDSRIGRKYPLEIFSKYMKNKKWASLGHSRHKTQLPRSLQTLSATISDCGERNVKICQMLNQMDSLMLLPTRSTAMSSKSPAARFGPQTSHIKFVINLSIFPHKINAVFHFHFECGADTN